MNFSKVSVLMKSKLLPCGEAVTGPGTPLSIGTELATSPIETLFISQGLYHKERIGHFPTKIKMLLSDFSSLPPLPSQIIKLWCLIRAPDVCMHLFIRIFIVSLSSSLPPWVHSRNFKNIHGKATKIKDLCLMNSLQHVGLGQSLK